MNTTLDLAPGEVSADRFDPADECATQPGATDAQIAAWESNPWF